jgi:hypothetical protein
LKKQLRAVDRGRSRFVVAAVLVAVCSFEANASAAKPRKKRAPPASTTQAPSQAPSSDKQAQSLLNQGRKLMKAGQYPQACPKIAESQSLAPSPTTLLELALCHENEGKIATTQNELTTVVMQSTNPKDPSAKTARVHADALLPKLPRLTIKVPAGSESKGVQITLDGLPVASSSWGLSNPIDPGTHQIVATTKGSPPWSTKVNVTSPGEQLTVDVPGPRAVDQAPPPPEPSPEKTAKVETPFGADTSPAKEEEEEPTHASRPALGYVLFGAGVVGTGVGTYFGLRAISLRKDSDQNCVSGCTVEGVDLNNRAKTAAWISDFGIGIGLIGVVIGGYMLLKTPDEAAPKQETTETSLRLMPELTSTRAGLNVGGTW